MVARRLDEHYIALESRSTFKIPHMHLKRTQELILSLRVHGGVVGGAGGGHRGCVNGVPHAKFIIFSFGPP